MLINVWKAHIEDGHVYRLVELRAYERTKTGFIPRLLWLEACSDFSDFAYIGLSGGVTVICEEAPVLDKILVENDSCYSVDPSAFSDFDHLSSFAKEVGALLECDPATIIKAI